jgi:hypothetical protein
MTREEAKQNVFLHTGMDSIEHYSSGFVDGVWILRTDVINFINQIFDEHEVELKQAYINGSNSTNELIQSLYRQIEALKDNK